MRRISFCLVRRSLIFVFRARKGRGIADAGSVNGAARIARPCNDERAIMKAMWSKSVKYIRSGGAVSRLRMKARLRQQHTQSDGKAITEIEEGADVKYWQQGDVGMYSEENVAKRAALRQNGSVLDALHGWWKCALNGYTAVTATEADGVATAQLTKEQYMDVMRKLYKVMIEADEFDEEDARASAEEDWERDVQGSVAMQRETFGDALVRAHARVQPASDP